MSLLPLLLSFLLVLNAKEVVLRIPPEVSLTMIDLSNTSVWRFEGIASSPLKSPICPWNQNRPLKELNQALSQLRQAMGVISQCQSDNQYQNLFRQVQNLEKASVVLKDFWNGLQNPDAVNPQLIGNFQSSFQEVLTQFNSVFTQFESLFSRQNECGRSLNSHVDVLVALTDLVASLTPFALVGAAMNPSIKVALPFILGITGIGSLAKIFQNLQNQNSLDVSRPEIRQAILENLCEFNKIHARVRFIRWAQSGHFDQIDQEISELQKKLDQQLFLLKDPKLASFRKFETQTRERLRQISNQQQQLLKSLQSIDSQLKTFNQRLFCKYMKASIQDDSNLFKQIETLFLNLLEIQENPSYHQTTLLTLLREYQNELSKAKSVSTCQEHGQSLISLSYVILENIYASTQNLITQLDEFIQNAQPYQTIKKQEIQIKAEIEQIKAIKQILQNLKSSGGLVDQIEMNILFTQVKNILFGKSTGLPGFRRIAPARSWLDFIWNLTLHYQNIGWQEINRLQNIAYQLALNDQAKQNPSNKGSKQNTESEKHLLVAAVHLTSLNPPSDQKLFTYWKPRVCRHLENALGYYSVVMNQLEIGLAFCQFIQPFFDADTDPKIIRYCENPKPGLSRKSLIQEKLDKLSKDYHQTWKPKLKTLHTKWGCVPPPITPLN